MESINNINSNDLISILDSMLNKKKGIIYVNKKINGKK